MTRRLIQVAPGVNPGDAITNEIRIIDRYFCAAPFNDLVDATEVYAEHIHSDLRDFARPAKLCRPAPGDLVIYHYGIAARITESVRAWRCAARVLVYHNITPAYFYRPYSLYVAGRLERARRELRELRNCFDLVLADSQFNRAELEACGFADVRVMPVLFTPPQFSDRRPPARAGSAPRMLFVGRIAPNKGHADLIKILYYVRMQSPGAKLVLAGAVAAHAELYLAELQALARSLDVADAVEFTGFVADEELARLYREADVFVSASAHEGFCVPLLEAMGYDLPVIAYRSAHSAVAETMAGAGVLFDRLDYPRVAEVIQSLVNDDELRAGVIARQRERIQRHDNRKIFERDLYDALKSTLSVGVQR